MKSTTKRLLLGLVMMVCLTVLMAICAGAEDVTYSEGLEFTSNGDGTCYLSGLGTCTDENLVIPSVVNGETVVAICEFSGLGTRYPKYLAGYTTYLPPGDENFMKALAYISMYHGDDALKELAEIAERITGVKSITIPHTVNRIGYFTFEWSTIINTSAMQIEVFYCGTEEEWKQITIESRNTGLSKTTIHYMGDWEKTVVEPTCTEKGYTYDRCKCGEKHNYSEIDSLGHNYQSDISAPTCTENGYITYTCSRCGDTYTEKGSPATGHNEIVTPAVAPTCTETGLTEGKHCSVCGEILEEQQTVPANGHNYEMIHIPPTCTEEGLIIGICSVCGHESIVAGYFPKGHDYECVTIIQHCTKEGKKVFTCSRCGDSYEELIPPIGHENIEWLYHTQTNELMAHCEWCGDILVQQEKAKITGASLALGESLSMKYYATMPDLLFETAEVWMRFTYDGQEFWADGVKDSKSGEYVFALNRIPPSKKDSIIKAELCVVSGIVVVGDDGSDWRDCAVIAAKESYSIGMYYQDVKAYDPDNESLNRLVSALEVYNKAAKNYENGVSADPSDVDWTPVIDTDYNLSEPAAETTYFTAAGVRFGYVNRLFFKFTADDLNGLTVTVNGTDYTATDFTLVEGTENAYIIYSEGIYATEFDKVFEVVLAINGEEVQTLEYSVKSYVKAKQDDPEMGALVRALYNYGKSSELYRNEM